MIGYTSEESTNQVIYCLEDYLYKTLPDFDMVFDGCKVQEDQD